MVNREKIGAMYLAPGIISNVVKRDWATRDREKSLGGIVNVGYSPTTIPSIASTELKGKLYRSARLPGFLASLLNST